MRWLLTIGTETDLDELGAEVARLGGTVDAGSLVPLDGEHVVEAEGPDDLGAGLERAGWDDVRAYPSSDLELYGSSDAGEGQAEPGDGA